MRTKSVWLNTAFILLITAAISSGQILGKNYLEAKYSYHEFGDAPEGTDDYRNLYGIGTRLAGEDYPIDFIADIQIGKQENNDLTFATVGVQPYFISDDQMYKLFGSLNVLYTRIETDEIIEDDYGISAGGGIELDLGSTASLSTELAVVTFNEAENDIVVGASISKWFQNRYLLNIGFEYGTHSEETRGHFGAGFSL